MGEFMCGLKDLKLRFKSGIKKKHFCHGIGVAVEIAKINIGKLTVAFISKEYCNIMTYSSTSVI